MEIENSLVKVNEEDENVRAVWKSTVAVGAAKCLTCCSYCPHLSPSLFKTGVNFGLCPSLLSVP